MKNIHAQELQKLSHGIPKVYTEAEKEKRRERLRIARSKRKTNKGVEKRNEKQTR